MSNFGGAGNFGGFDESQNFIGCKMLKENGHQLGNNSSTGYGFNGLGENGQLGNNNAGASGNNCLQGNSSQELAFGTNNFNVTNVNTLNAAPRTGCPAHCYPSLPFDPCNQHRKWCPRGCCPLGPLEF